MEKIVIDLDSKCEIIAYRDEHRLAGYEPVILNEILAAVESGNIELLQFFNSFGSSYRAILMNVHAYRKGLEFGFSEIAFDQYGWFKRPLFFETEMLVFGNASKYCEHSRVTIARGANAIWTYGLDYSFGTAGGCSGISVYGKQFVSRQSAVTAGITDLKQMMLDKKGHSDTTNYKPQIISATLKAISFYEISQVQLSLF